MLHTAEEEEALVPLVRNRRHRARAPLPPAADKEQAIEVPGDVKTSSSCGRGVSARVRDLFHVRDGSSRQLYALITFEVSTVICNLSFTRILILTLQVLLLLVCCVLLYWCYHYPSWFHYQVKLC